MLSALTEKTAVFSLAADNRFLARVESLFQRAAGGEAFSAAALSAAGYSLICLLHELTVAPGEPSLCGIKHERDGRRVREAVQRYVSCHLPEVTVARLAAAAGYSEKYFYRYFKKMTGQPPNAFITDERVRAAAIRLAQTRRSVREIAHEVGFRDPFYFSRVFKRQQGMSPLAFRKAKGGVFPVDRLV